MYKPSKNFVPFHHRTDKMRSPLNKWIFFVNKWILISLKGHFDLGWPIQIGRLRVWTIGFSHKIMRFSERFGFLMYKNYCMNGNKSFGNLLCEKHVISIVFGFSLFGRSKIGVRVISFNYIFRMFLDFYGRYWTL